MSVFKNSKEIEQTLRDNKSSEFEKKILLKKMEKMKNLPTPSAHVMQVMLLLRDEEVRMDELVQAIQQDQSLVAQILKLINSGYYGLRKTIDSVERAIGLLGILNVKQVVYSASIMDLFSDDEQLEWHHSYTSSVLMTRIMREHEIPAASNLPLTMLLHDIGKIVLRRHSPKKYQLARTHSAEYDVPMFEAEEIIIHASHAEIGSFLMEKWDMTEDIIWPIRNHHTRGLPEQFVLETALTQLINWIDCRARGIRCYDPSQELLTEAGIEEFDKDYWINYQRNLILELEGEEGIVDESSGSDAAPVDRREDALVAPPSHIGTCTDEDFDAAAAMRAAGQEQTEQGTSIIKRPDEEATSKKTEPEKEEVKRPDAGPPEPEKTESGTDVIKRPRRESAVTAENDTKVIKRPRQ